MKLKVNIPVTEITEDKTYKLVREVEVEITDDQLKLLFDELVKNRVMEIRKELAS